KSGTKFSHGYFYPGKYHDHWSFSCWDARYRCRLYWDSGCFCYYYWCPVAACYYAVRYCPYGTYSWSSGGAEPQGVAIAAADVMPQSPADESGPVQPLVASPEISKPGEDN